MYTAGLGSQRLDEGTVNTPSVLGYAAGNFFRHVTGTQARSFGGIANHLLVGEGSWVDLEWQRISCAWSLVRDGWQPQYRGRKSSPSLTEGCDGEATTNYLVPLARPWGIGPQ